MRRYLLIAAALLGFSSQALAADSSVPAMSAAGAIADTDLFYCAQSAGTTDRKCTPVQLATYLFGKVSADATASGAGALTLATVNGNVGSFGSATACASFTVNAKGLVTAASSATCTPAIGSVTGLGTGVGTALGVNVGTAGAFVVLNGVGGTPSAITLTNGTGLPIGGITGLGTGVATALAAAMNGSTGPIGTLTPTNNNCVVGNGSAWTSAACGGGSGTVTSIATSCGISGGTITTTGTITASIAAVPQTGSNYPIVTGDCGSLLNLSNASPQIPTIAQAGSAGFLAGWYVSVCNQGAGTQTITPTTSTIGGAATYVLAAGSAAAPKCVGVISDGTNYQVVPTSVGATTDASLLTSGTLAAGRMPALTGDVTSSAGSTATTLAAGSASNLNSGTLNAARLPALTNDCVSAAGSASLDCSMPGPAYIANNWYLPWGTGTVTTGSALTLNIIRCSPAIIPQRTTIGALGMRVGTAGTNASLAMYASSSGRPGAKIGETAPIDVSGAAGAKTGALLANKQVGPGGTDGGRVIWLCYNGDNSSTVGVGVASSNGNYAGLIGSSSSGQILNAATPIIGLTCTGAACTGGSSTFPTSGNWPATLAGTTWTDSSGSVTIPLIGFQLASVP